MELCRLLPAPDVCGQPAGKVAVPCKYCQETDHITVDCMVAAVLPKPREATNETWQRVTTHGTTQGWTPSKGKRPAPYPQQQPLRMSWNTGSCKFAGTCSYAHVCCNSYGPHPASSCKECPFSGTSPSTHQAPTAPK